ncbi:MAG: hypothetical protein KGD63_02005 [Candidatus Lokiarchaeota archaeon]|nr:hypothetical protein [Candidatus Lokiarchaeota archaeon]
MELPSRNYQIISTPFRQDSAEEFYWRTTDISNFVNSWNLATFTVNVVDFTNSWISTNNLPEKIDGYYYIHYVGNWRWSHIEIR